MSTDLTESERLAVVARLLPGSRERAQEIIAAGAPYELGETGFVRHQIFLGEETAACLRGPGRRRPGEQADRRSRQLGLLQRVGPPARGDADACPGGVLLVERVVAREPAFVLSRWRRGNHHDENAAPPWSEKPSSRVRSGASGTAPARSRSSSSTATSTGTSASGRASSSSSCRPSPRARSSTSGFATASRPRALSEAQ